MKAKVHEKIESGKQVGKNGLQRVIYGRTLILFLLLLVQISGLVLIAGWLEGASLFIYTAFSVIGLLVAVNVINRDIDPYMKIAWLVPILVAPMLGIVCYLFIQSQTGGPANQQAPACHYQGNLTLSAAG